MLARFNFILSYELVHCSSYTDGLLDELDRLSPETLPLHICDRPHRYMIAAYWLCHMNSPSGIEYLTAMVRVINNPAVIVECTGKIIAHMVKIRNWQPTENYVNMLRLYNEIFISAITA